MLKKIPAVPGGIKGGTAGARRKVAAKVNAFRLNRSAQMKLIKKTAQAAHKSAAKKKPKEAAGFLIGAACAAPPFSVPIDTLNIHHRRTEFKGIFCCLGCFKCFLGLSRGFNPPADAAA
jgi:hypothetical protein